MEVFIVVIEHKVDKTQSAYWIHASNSTIAKNRALRMVGQAEFRVVRVDPLGQFASPDQFQPQTGEPRKAGKTSRKTVKKRSRD